MEDHASNKESSASVFILISVVYAVCIILFFFPCFQTFSSALIGPPEDNMQDFWNLWYSQNALENNFPSFFYTNLIYYPEGTSLRYHSLSYSNLLILFVVRKLMFLPLTVKTLIVLHNSMLLITFYISAAASFYLVRRYTDDLMSSIIGGFIFAFSPFHFAHSLHHIGLASIQYLPLFVLFFDKYIETGRNFYLFGTVLSYVLGALSYWYYLLYNICYLIYYYMFRAITDRKLVIRDLAVPMIKIQALVLFLLSPLIVPMILESIGSKTVYASGHNVDVADLLSFFIFHPYHLLNGLTGNINAHFTGNDWEKTAYFGLANIGLIAWWFFAKQKKHPILNARFYMYGMLFFMLLAGGSYLHVYGVETPLPLPTLLTQHIPLWANMRTPSRAVVYAYLFLAVIISLIVKNYTSLMDKKRRNIFLTVFCVLIFVDYYPNNVETTGAEFPVAYEVIKKDKDRDFAVIDLPAGYSEGNLYMFYQTSHELPIVNATTSRKLNNTLADEILKYDLADQRILLQQNRVKYMVIHKYFFRNEEVINDYLKLYPVVYRSLNHIVLKVY